MRQFLRIALGITLLVVTTSFQPTPRTVQHGDVSETAFRIDHLKDRLTRTDTIMVVAHRGDWRHAPENSLQAIQNCIDMGVDMVEIDVQPTKDGQLVLMHDATVNRTTTGKGKVSDWTLDSLKTLYLRNGANHPTHHRIPTLEEAMLVAKGKILVNLDKCYGHFDKAFEVLLKTGTVDHVVMKGKVPLAQLKAEFGRYLNQVYFMPVVNLGDHDAENVIDEYRKGLKPVAYELVFGDLKSPVLEKLHDLRKDGSRIWVNSLWASLNAGYTDDMALIDPDGIYGWYVDKGINMIQTDRPALLIKYLRAKGLRD